MVWKADNAERLCNWMQVHPWAKRVTGLGSISKVHLNQTHSHLLHLESASAVGIWVGFSTGVIGCHVPSVDSGKTHHVRES